MGNRHSTRQGQESSASPLTEPGATGFASDNAIIGPVGSGADSNELMSSKNTHLMGDAMNQVLSRSAPDSAKGATNSRLPSLATSSSRLSSSGSSGSSGSGSKSPTTASTLSTSTSIDNVQTFLEMLSNVVPDIVATLGALGEHAPLVGVVFSILKLSGELLSAKDQAWEAYDRFSQVVMSTGRVMIELETVRRRANKVLAPQLQMPLNAFWKQLEAFVALRIAFGNSHPLQHLWSSNDNLDKLDDIRNKIEHAKTDLSLAGILENVSQSDLILERLERVLSTYASKAPATGGVWSINFVHTIPEDQFFGREQELLRLDEVLLPSPTREWARIVVITGLVGIGKSSLAQLAVMRCKGRFERGWTLNGSNRNTLFTSLVAIATSLSIKYENGGIFEVAEAVRTKLSEDAYQGWLLVVDNFDDSEIISAYEPLLPNMGGCVLITSRSAAAFNRGTIIDLGKMMTEADALHVLTMGLPLPPGDEIPDVAAVAEAVGRLPIALTQARANTKRKTITWKKYLSLLKGKTDPDLEILQGSFRHSLAQPGIRHLVQLLQVLHPEEIPRQLVSATLNQLEAEVDDDEALAVLAGTSVITLTYTSISLHRKMQEAMMKEVPCEAAVVVKLSEVMSQLVETNRRSDDALMRSLLDQYGQVISALERLCPESAALGAAWHAVGTIYCYSFQNNLEAAIAYEKARRLQEAALGPDHVAVAKTLRRLGITIGVEGCDPPSLNRAQELIKRALEVNTRHYGRDHLEVAETKANLAEAYWAGGDYARQRDLLLETLAIKETQLRRVAGASPRTGLSADNSSDSIEQQLKLSIAVTLNSLGGAYSSLGEPAKGKEYLVRALDIKQQHYGHEANNGTIALSYLSLGLVLIDCGELEQARLSLLRALPTLERLDHPYLKLVHQGLGKISTTLEQGN